MMGVLNHLSTLLLLSLLPPALSHVVDKFSDVPQCKTFFLKETTPNLPGILVGGTVQNQNRYKPICQLFNNTYRFATLYDTTNRIPVFSAYTFSGKEVGRPSQSWMMEPQLEGVVEEEMKNQSVVKKRNNNEDIRFQAVNKDYDNNTLGLEKGHLFPCSYAPDNDTKKSTFTLTNAVPQESSFNKGSWKTMECRVRKALELNCKDNNNKIKAYVVTGAVPSSSNKLNNRVNIPDLLWTAYCCYNNTKNWTVGAYWGENRNGNGNILNLETLGELEAKLNQSYNGTVKVFHDNCPRNITVRVNKRTREETESECVEK
ncbi:endonuclease domain-containing 1 protein-like [Oncorhynchus tshawytscha]|uniref:Endonuclease domain-containing 1 protein-like n=1 Tax=Oncorhynchus tshawytscha TaxID=74940 RepID=A0AAZ3SWH6_ONCTS|nr:endonuclease domain-containing 1 protein-like [Oncorhynchus tshawytscha]